MRDYHIIIQLDSQIRQEGSTVYSAHTFTPSSLFQLLPSHPSSSNTIRRNTLRKAAGKDYRYGSIKIDWVDFEIMTSSAAVGKEKQQSSSTPIATFIPSLSSKSGSTNLPDGIIHIYRDGLSASDPNPSAASTSKAVHSSAKHSLPSPADENAADITDQQCTTLAVLAVPQWMNPSDFLAFVAPAAEGMAHLRLIRDASPNRTMVLIQFRDSESTAEFIEEFNGRPFNSVEPEICNIVRVKSIKIDINDPVSLAVTRSSAHPNVMYELPTCPVCLDRMDTTVTGLVTVPCSHTFHCMCLSKWGDSRCPVCRYSQNALSSNSKSTSSTTRATHMDSVPVSGLTTCTDCDSRINLWICLICGNIGCGRQGRAHAMGHYELTTHLYALELETQRVWDYAGDNYVHRLIQNKSDGKLVELPSASNMEDESNARGHTGQGPGVDDDLKAEKVEIMAMQYSQILQRALDDQRESYEEQTTDLRKKVEETQKKMEILNHDFEMHMLEMKEDRDRRKKEEEERRSQIDKERIKAEKKAEKLAELARKLEKDLNEERAVSEGLMNNLAKMKERVEVADKEKAQFSAQIADLEDQVRDVMFFLEAKAKIELGEGEESEAAGGSVELPTPVSPPPKSTKKKKKAK